MQENLKQGSIRTIIADSAPSGMIFNSWTGDTAYLDDPMASTTIVTMPAQNVSVTASYTSIPITSIKYGLLCNWYAATDARNICSVGWHVSTKVELETLQTYLGGILIAGGKLKETGLTHWITPNTGATNEVGFNARGSGSRNYNTGIFSGLNLGVTYWTTEQSDSIRAYSFNLRNDDEIFGSGTERMKTGHNIRILKDSTTLTHGQTGVYIGNDGKVYRTICIGTQEWLADNLAETKYANGDWIDGFNGGVYTPVDNATWAAASTGMLCCYNDDLDNI